MKSEVGMRKAEKKIEVGSKLRWEVGMRPSTSSGETKSEMKEGGTGSGKWERGSRKLEREEFHQFLNPSILCLHHLVRRTRFAGPAAVQCRP